MMAAVREHLESQGLEFEFVTHEQAYTSIGEAQALGIDAGEVIKTVAVRSGSGHALMVVPATRRLDMHLVRDAVNDNHARLATEEELGSAFPDCELGALPPLGSLLGVPVYVDPEVLGHDTVVFAAGSQTESVKMRTVDLFQQEGATTTPLAQRLSATEKEWFQR